ncbi:GTP-binding protein [Cocleimonas flava]|uniref:G3E family GTPase n=1 Tax=Cocleimonas flava TaxID=634765 RepID=A0A4R1ETF4_9GAMM|nr:GTP-binding protein [Cocleimonas flava]TCJ83019.1 G3E family GTPase [Cocleimonas flava]
MIKSNSIRLPIITIGGFLGAGKTTLVNSLLSKSEGKRFVVFVNDFGAINIDHALIKTVEQDRISLKNGCVCCSLNEDLVKSISNFSSSKKPPDAVVIEASGVSDPRALDSSFNMLEASGAAFLDTRVYVLDAEGFGGLNYEDSELIVDHAVAADLVLLNKCDLITLEKLNLLKSLISESAPYSNVQETTHCELPIKIILSDNHFLGRKRNVHFSEVINHEEKYTQWSCETDSLIDRDSFLQFVNEFSQYCFRSKGFLRFSDEPDELISFNLVGLRASYEKLGKRPSLSSQLVMIGRREIMNVEVFKTGFNDIQVIC